MTWVFDTFAYMVGSKIGKNKILPKISPKKSWEGFIGGYIFTLLSVYFINQYFECFSLNFLILLALVIPFTASTGDFIASYYKRIANVKDSGIIIPGHGGMLDRMDAFMISIPVLYILINLLNENSFEFCWIVDFPMYELDEKTNKIEFSHNPFSMPQGEMDSLLNINPLDIKAYQYDIVCNGVELSSGAIRNHRPDIMYKAFEIAGYKKEELESKFSGMLNAMKFGAPPHGGSAPGIDRIAMLLSNEPNIREVIAFPMNQFDQFLTADVPKERCCSTEYFSEISTSQFRLEYVHENR